MIKVFFFASIREELGTSELIMEWNEGSVTDLIRQLGNQQGNQYKDVLACENLLTSVNQDMVSGDHPVRDGDEIGFFPPVTGG